MNNYKLNKIRKILINFIFALFLLGFFISSDFQDNRSGGWYLQYITLIGNRQISDVTFLDSLTGFAVTPYVSTSDSTFIVKTTNGGDNWFISLGQPGTAGGFTRIQFINNQTSFVSGNFFKKTTNTGLTWLPVNTSGIYPENFYALNNDTIWLVNSNGLEGGIFRTTNSGQSWSVQYSEFGNNPDKIYMVNKYLGFIRKGHAPFGSYMGRTTNGGFNWTMTIADTTFTDMIFIDSLTGYKVDYNIQKTTDGGITWFNQKLPQLNYRNQIFYLCAINRDTLWGSGGVYAYNSFNRGILYKTTNGGINWGYQIPDTNFNIATYSLIKFVNNLKGWAFNAFSSPKDIHTTTGGDSTLFTNIENNNTTIINPKNFELKQNYPNPYNSSSLIEYFLNERGLVRIKLYDITGKEIATLVNEVQGTGGYGIPVSIQLPSGIYFYKMIFIPRNREVQADTKKLVIVK